MRLYSRTDRHHRCDSESVGYLWMGLELWGHAGRVCAFVLYRAGSERRVRV